MAQPSPRLAIITADGTEYLVGGNLARIVEALLAEQSFIELCGNKLHIEIDCAGGQPDMDIGKRGVRPKKSA